ncbi:ral guanine nucleotide dissociation stimulator [Brachionus plicatilis]|uniref:Ral guanine nucleotide dissociation stimulator n=1 Tax=Brachionus plicatilis TaxID=10195 RepID=A0A3M7SQC6_BRAPC|nr:ral guanine nucleotide dissociation stimulator [Brachionus plicatilis]
MSKNFSKRNSTSFTNLNNFFATNEPNFGRDKADLNSSLSNLRSSNSEFKFRPKSQITSLESESYDFEEQGDDCIYQISFKKVYNTQLTDSNNNQVNSGANSGLVYTRVKLKQLRYASLSKFIEHLVNSDTGEIDSNLVHTFLATYRTFSDTRTVLSMLRQQYARVMPASLEMTEDVRQQYLKSLRLIIKLWLKNYSEDFNEPSDYPNLNELYRFGQNYFADSGLIGLVRSKFEQFKASDQSSDSLEGSSTSFGAVDQAQAGLNVDEDFLSVDSKYFAEQLTFLDKIYFQKLCAHHCLGSVWGTRYQKSSKMTLSNNSDNLLAMPLSDKFADSALSIKQFNLVTDYIQSSILQDVELKPAQRAKIVRKWIEIARHCRKLKNFNSLNAIVLSLNGPYVSRLEKCWAEVPAEEKREFDKLSEIFSQEKNQQMLRDILIRLTVFLAHL